MKRRIDERYSPIYRESDSECIMNYPPPPLKGGGHININTNELWPWKCSAINRQLIVGKYEWGNEFSTVSRMGLVKLNSEWRYSVNVAGQRDPISFTVMIYRLYSFYV